MLEFSVNDALHKGLPFEADTKKAVHRSGVKARKPDTFYPETIRFDEARQILGQWRELAANAIEPNPYYEPGYLLAVDKHLLPDEDQHLVLVWAGADKATLLGLFPISVRGMQKGFLLPVSNLTFDSMIGVCTPLISGQNPEQVWRCFFDFMDTHSLFPGVVHINEFYADGPVGKALGELVRDNGASHHVAQGFYRAVATSAQSFESYSDRWSKKKARNIRSRRRKLEALGNLSFEVLTVADVDFQDCLDAILALEVSGWKGKQGTALASQPHTAAFAQQAFTSSHSDTETHLAIMRLDGRIIAGQINLISQSHAFFIKSAYDETLSGFGPGVALYTWVLERALDDGLYVELDSCADANHSLEEIWLERKLVQDVFISAPSRTNGLKIGVILTARSVLKKLKAKAKELLNRSR